MIRIVTDSAANLSPDVAKQYNIPIVPLKVQFGTTTYREGIDLSQDEFFVRLAQANPLPTTSQPSPAEFEDVFRDIVQEGDEVIAVTISSKLSGTYNSARNGALALGANAPISVVDSLSASGGTGLLVLAAAKLAEAGWSRDKIVEQVQKLADQILLVLTLDTLEYLKKGGRIGGAQAFLGGLLRVKPVILLKDGVIEAAGRARSRGKAIDQLVQMEVERFGTQPVWVSLAQAQADDISILERQANDSLSIQQLLRADIGPVVATHTGPGVLGIAAMPVPTGL